MRGGGGPGISCFDWSESFHGILGTYLEITCSEGLQYLHGKTIGPTLTLVGLLCICVPKFHAGTTSRRFHQES